MLSKKELIEQKNNHVKFCGFSDEEQLINDNNIQARVDWHGMYFLFKRDINLNFPYNNTICKVIGQCEDGSIECEFEPRDFNGNIKEDEEKAIIAFEYAEDSNGLIDYDPIFKRIE